MTDAFTANQVHRSPPLSLLACVSVGLFLASMLATYVMTAGAPYPIPYNPIEQSQEYYTRFPDVMRVVSFLQFGAATTLGLFGVVMVSRLLFHRITVAGVHIALFGAIAAASFAGVSALATWALSQPGIATNAGAMRTVQLLAFATGGVGSVAATGLLVAGVSVPSLAFHLMPRWIGWFGLVIAAIAEVSVISMVFPAASPLLPLARFPGFVWMLAASFAMPKQ